MSITTRLRPGNPKKDGTRQVQVVYLYNGKRTYFTPAFNPSVRDDQFESGRVTSHPNKKEINSSIEALISKIYAAAAGLNLKGKEPTGREIKKEIEGPSKEDLLISDAFSEYMHSMKLLGCSQSTIQNKETIGKILSSYQEKYGQQAIRQFDSSFKEKFIAGILAGNFTKGRPVSNGTLRTYIDQFCHFIKWCAEKEYYEGNIHEKIHKYVREKYNHRAKKKPGLSIEEVKKIENLDLSDSPEKYGAIRDIFLFMAYTGARWKDTFRIQAENFREYQPESGPRLVLEYSAHKTEKRAVILVKKAAMGFFGKILPDSGQIFEEISLTYFNETIKKIGHMAGLNRPFEQTITRQGKRITKRGPVWKFLTAHTGRTSFATDYICRKGSVVALQNILGHSSVSTTEKYFQVHGDDVLKEQMALGY